MGRLPGTLSYGCGALSAVFWISQVGAHRAHRAERLHIAKRYGASWPALY
jgi:hypothetical protein